MGRDAPVSVTVEGLVRRFGDVTALAGVNLSLKGSEIVGIAGPNGSGKTTLIRCLLGRLSPSAGSVRLNGIDPRNLSPGDRAAVGYMPQVAAVYEDLSVRANVTFFARLYGLDPVADPVDRVLDLVQLRAREDARVTDLSGGLLRRTSLACALVHEPSILVLDEPTVGVDPALRAEMWDAFRARTRAGVLTLVSTHYLAEADRCDRVLFLRDGGVLAFDTPNAFRTRTGASDLEGAFHSLLSRGDDGDKAQGVAQ